MATTKNPFEVIQAFATLMVVREVADAAGA